jgi:hypothetical protein
MKNPDHFHIGPPCNDGNADQYLGEPDQIEELLGLCHKTEGRSRAQEQVGPQHQEQIKSVPEKTK